MVADKFNLNNIDKSNWKSYRFDEIAINISERVDPNNTDLEVYIGLEHIDSESLHIKRSGTPDDVNGQKLKFYKGDIIFGRRRAYQRKAGIATSDGFCSAHALVLRANTGVIDSRLFPFFMHSDVFMNRAVDISVGSLSPTINWGTLKHQEFLVPPKNQQHELAELFWVMDDLVEKAICLNKKILETKKSYFRSVTKNIELEELRNVADVFYGLGQPPEKDENGVAVIRATDIQRGHIKEGSFMRVKREAIPKGKNVELKRGDLIIVRSGAYTGDLAMIPEHLEGAIAGYDLIIRTNCLAVNPKFLAEYLLDDVAQAYFKGESVRSAQPHLNSAQVLSAKIPKIDLPEQNAIAEKLEKFDLSICDSNRKIYSIALLQKTLINQVF